MPPIHPPQSRPLEFRLENTYAGLPAGFFEYVRPEAAPAPACVVFNQALATELGLLQAGDSAICDAADLAELFGGGRLPKDAQPIAQAYAGHQFGHFTMLGDGRALLWGEQRTPDGRLHDLAFKGSGATPYSRGGDGKAALGPMLREYLISEAMHALNIPTTRSLAVVTTGAPVFRETPLPGAVLTRTAASHLRVGTFQYAAHILQNVPEKPPELSDGQTAPSANSPAAVRILADYAIARHDPHLAALDAAARYRAFFEAVVARQLALVARWQAVGFVHGVMNTDNMTISGETIDYGPCAFMDRYDPMTVFSSIDRQGRYAYANQPVIAQWNLARLAEALLPLLGDTPAEGLAYAQATIEAIPGQFAVAWREAIGAKLGLRDIGAEDEPLLQDFLGTLHASGLDWTLTFHALGSRLSETGHGREAAESPHAELPAAWLALWQARLAAQNEPVADIAARMRAHNPAIIPRNHQVELALSAAQAGDMDPFHRLLAAITRPFAPATEDEAYRLPPPADAPPYRTFCGT